MSIRILTHWSRGHRLHTGDVDECTQGCGETMDEREPGEAFCASCPDHEACATGLPCSLVKRVAQQ